ncbi:MAG: UPF0109 protein [Patescibacteria group bacterium]|nr:MAG: UPF0109 protein [Patescibacteria group bacterium]
MKDLLHYIITSIVDKKDAVLIEEEIQEDGTVTLRLHVDDADMGKVIGKEGRVIKAIRSIVRIAAIREQKKVYIVLKDDEVKEEQQEESSE